MSASTDLAALDREIERLLAMLGDPGWREWQLRRVKETGPTMWWIALRLSIIRLHELTDCDPGGSRASTPLHS